MSSTRLNGKQILAEVRNESDWGCGEAPRPLGSRSPIGVGDRLHGNDEGGGFGRFANRPYRVNGWVVVWCAWGNGMGRVGC